MKYITLIYLILSTNLNAQKIETIKFDGTWVLLTEENSILVNDTLVLIKPNNREKDFELKQLLAKQNPKISQILFLEDRLYFNPYNINCGCKVSKFIWDLRIDKKKQTLNINARRKQKNKFKILTFEKSIFNDIDIDILKLVRI